MNTLKQLVASSTAAVLMAAPALAQPFKPFSVFFNSNGGPECQVTLAFPEADLCGTKLKPEQVIGWYSGRRQDHGPGFYIYTRDEMLKVRIMDPGANQRFNVEFQVWSGRKPTMPIDDYGSNLHLGN